MTERHSRFVDRTARLPDGRALGYAEYGDPDGRAVLHFHGTPSSRLDAQVAHVPAVQRGVRLIAIDRPGFGLSDFQPGRTLLDWPRDVASLADHLGLPAFSIVAVSGGAPHALACAVQIPERIRGVGIVNGFVPGGLRFFQPGLRWTNRIFMALLPRFAPWLLPPIFRRVARMADRDPQRLLAQIEAAVPAQDRSALATPEIVEAFFDTSHEAFRSGVDGAVLETCLFKKPWGFEPEDVRAPVWLFHGEDNRIVPAEAAQRLAQRIPKCTARILPGHAHIAFPRLLAQVLEAMLREHALD